MIEENVNNEQLIETIILEEQTSEMEESKNETISNTVDGNEITINNNSNGNNVNNKDSKKSNNASSHNTIKRTNNSKVKEIKPSSSSQNNNKENSTKAIEEEDNNEVIKKKDDTTKTKEVVVEIPDANTYKNDPAFIKLQKELFKTFKECNEVGENEWRRDSDNILSSYCEAEYYKGVEAGIRLYIIYNDKTRKKYVR